MKNLLLEYFGPIAKKRGISLRQATKATPRRWFTIISLMLLFFVTLPFFLVGHWWSLILLPQLAWVTIANYWHDSLHFSLSTNWRINAFLPNLFPTAPASASQQLLLVISQVVRLCQLL